MEEIWIKKKRFVIQSIVAQHEDHDSYICLYAGVTYLVRVYREEYAKVLADYKRLKHAGINMAKIAFHDDERQTIAFDAFTEEKDVLKRLAEGPLTDEYFEALFSCYRFARFSKIALDWAPQNFMLRGTQMFYLPIKVDTLTDANRLEASGLALWFRGRELKALLDKKGYNVSNFNMMSDAEVSKMMALMTVKYY